MGQLVKTRCVSQPVATNIKSKSKIMNLKSIHPIGSLTAI